MPSFGDWAGDISGITPGAVLKGKQGAAPGLPYGGTQGGQPAGTQNFGGGAQKAGKKGAMPTAPDFYGAAQATSQGSQNAVNQQTMANRPNQSTPFANQQWTRNPDGSWTQNTSLSGQLGQAASGLQNQIAGQAGTPLPTGEAGRQAASDAVYNQYTSRLDPQWNQRQSQLQSQLVNQGLDPSSQASSLAMGDFNRARNDAYGSAMRDAAVTGMGQQALSFQQDMAGRQLPFQQLLGLQGLTGMPGFNAANQYQPTNYLGAATDAGQYGLEASGALQSKKGNTAAGLGSLGGAAMAAFA